MFFLEGLSKLLSLLLVVVLSTTVTDGVTAITGNCGEEVWRRAVLIERYMGVMLIANVLQEVGELQECNWDRNKYFEVIPPPLTP